jgi:hypothetical protein
VNQCEVKFFSWTYRSNCRTEPSSLHTVVWTWIMSPFQFSMFSSVQDFVTMANLCICENQFTFDWSTSVWFNFYATFTILLTDFFINFSTWWLTIVALPHRLTYVKFKDPSVPLMLCTSFRSNATILKKILTRSSMTWLWPQKATDTRGHQEPWVSVVILVALYVPLWLWRATETRGGQSASTC